MMELENFGTDGLSAEQLTRILDRFSIHGTVQKIRQIKKGYINLTFEVDTLSPAGLIHKYTLQRVNTNVFANPDALMRNFTLVTEHLKDIYRLPGAEDGQLSVLSLRLTKDGKTHYSEGKDCWRIVKYIDGVYSLDVPDCPETFRRAGEAFGLFVRKMSDVEPNRFVEIIPNFHNTARRYEDLLRSIARDPLGRAKDVQTEIASVESRVPFYRVIPDALKNGEIPTRICHNDCNLNNILFRDGTHLPVAVIDLDTVMPSSPLYDYGDSMRIGTNPAKDDEKDLSRVYCDLGLYEEYARGYLSACGDMLTQRELELLPLACIVITSEDGIRFLMDHIDGDTYYQTDYPGQNLDRSRTQLRLAEDMVRKFPEIKRILNSIYKELGLSARLDVNE